MKNLIIAGAVLLTSAGYASAGALTELKSEVPPSEPGAAAAPAVSTPAAISSELANFWEGLKKNTFDDICRNAEIKLNQEGKLVNVLGLGGKFNRYMRRFPGANVALIDEVGVSLSATVGNETLHLTDLPGAAVTLSGLLEGKSQVIQPLGSDRYCKELGTLAKFYQVKTILPAKAERIAAMSNGEIWKLPLTLRLGFSSSFGTPAAEGLNVSLSAGRTGETKPSVTLYRMDANRLRLRLRLDRVEVNSVGASVSSIQLPMSEIGLPGGENILARLVKQQLAREINKYVAFNLSFGHSRFDGKKLLLEFILDPKDAAQMENLENFLRGDFGILKRFIELGLNFNSFSENDDSAEGLNNINSAGGQVGQGLGVNPSFSGSNIYHGHTDSLHLQLPIIHTRDSNRTTAYNRYQSTAKEGETLHVQQRGSASSGSTMNIPFAKTLMKYDSNRNVYVVNKETAGKAAGSSALIYQQYEGFVTQGDATARGMLEHANGVLRYVGMNGNGTDQSSTLPAGTIFPAVPDTEPADPFGPPSLGPSKTYKSALMSFKLIINEGGVREILAAPAEAVMKAYLNVMREGFGTLLDKVADLLKVGADGVVTYSKEAAAERLGMLPYDELEDSTNPLKLVDTLVEGASRVILDLASVNSAGDWKRRSERLAAVSAGDSKSGLGYEDFLKVAVQLADRKNVSAAVYVHTDKRVKGEADVTQTYQFFNSRDASFDGTVAEVEQMRDRFNNPAELTD